MLCVEERGFWSARCGMGNASTEPKVEHSILRGEGGPLERCLLHIGGECKVNDNSMLYGNGVK